MLGAGTGQRLRPLSELRPKVLCPVANRPLVDWAVERVRAVTDDVAVNVHHLREQLEEHLAGVRLGGAPEAGPEADPGGVTAVGPGTVPPPGRAAVHVSVEAARPLGTAGALGALRDWVDGRPVLTVNGDTWCPAPLRRLLDGWDGERVRVLVQGWQPLGPRARVVGSVMPWSVTRTLPAAPLGLWEAVWRARIEDGTLETVGWDGPFVDCARPADYLAANLAALDWLGLDALVDGASTVAGTVTRSVVGPGARIDGRLWRSVVWPGASVARSERLVDAIRADRGLTVLVR